MTETLRAYRAHPLVTRDVTLAHIKAHAEADKIVQGRYGRMSEGGKFTGCAVGCTIRSIALQLGDDLNTSNHADYEKYIGVPLVLAKLEDRIFEGLPTEIAKHWPMRFAAAIQDGADLSQVWNKFAPWMLREICLPSLRDGHDQVRAVVERVARGYETNWQDDTPREARAAAYAAADAAAYAYAYADADAAAYAAAYAAAAADAYAYADADAAAYAAAYARYEARVAVRHSAYEKMADKLVELMSAAPVEA